jgi:hypothetical protein
MFGASRSATRKKRYSQTFWEAWNRNVVNLDPTWSARVVGSVRETTESHFREFCDWDADDKIAVRTCLAAHTLSLAKFGVVVIPPPPNVDETGFRDGQLVTGELRPLVDRIAGEPEARKLLGFEMSASITDPYHFCLGKYQISYVVALAFNSLRVMLEQPKAPDWYAPSAKIIYAYWENEFRRVLLLPETLPHAIDRLRYSTIVNLIANGVTNPYSKWCEE